eukprot:m.52985 g.52985  ORF g.52985 m.52985 type:complete len:213 (-) comp10832_c0_seq1:5443-6081(-)
MPKKATVEFTKSDEAIGLGVADATEDSNGYPVIKKLAEGGVASKQKGLAVGHIVLEVNGKDVKGKSGHDIHEIVRGTAKGQSLKFTVQPPKKQSLDGMDLATIKGLSAKWHFPKAGREEAEVMLKARPSGSFVIRSSSQPKHCTLSVKKPNGDLWNSLIEIKDDGSYKTKVGTEPFKELAAIILELINNKDFGKKLGLPAKIVMPAYKTQEV